MTVEPESYAGPKEFVHCHCHTYYSYLDGCASPTEYADQCAKRGYPAMAVTEHGHMGSVPDIYTAFKKAKVKPILGCEIYFCDYEPERRKLGADFRKLKESDPANYQRMSRNRHLTVLAKNETGYVNLLKLTTQAYKTGFYYKPRIWFDKLLEYKEGLIVLSGCLNGPICHELRVGVDGRDKPRFTSPDKRGAVDWVKRFKEAFGDDYKIELQMPGVEGDVPVFKQLVTIADFYKIETVCTNDTHYLARELWEVQKIMMAIDQDVPVDSPNLFHSNSDEQYFKSRAELWARFKNEPYSEGIDDGLFERSCDNTLKLAEGCQPPKLDASPKIPTFENADTKLVKLVQTKLRERGLDKVQKKYLVDGQEVTYAQQARIELERIIDKGFSSYFLITHTLIEYGLSRGWPFSPRGSAGGSLVIHLLGVSPIDPLKFGLSFDRFLSPSRGGFLLNVSMPVPVTNGVVT